MPCRPRHPEPYNKEQPPTPGYKLDLSSSYRNPPAAEICSHLFNGRTYDSLAAIAAAGLSRGEVWLPKSAPSDSLHLQLGDKCYSHSLLLFIYCMLPPFIELIT